MPTFRVSYLRKLDYHGEIEIDAADEPAARVKFLNCETEIEESWNEAQQTGVGITHVSQVDATPAPETPERPACSKCGSFAVTRDASAIWDDNVKTWVLSDLQDAIYCEHCDEQV